MLKYKIKEILLATGKKNPAKWLEKNCGFAKGKAQNIIKGQQTMISFADLSTLCEILHCTPNDLMYWDNVPNHLIHALHPVISQLKLPSEIPAMDFMLKRLTVEGILEVNEFARQKLESEIQARNNISQN